jgi:hypothetical protein
VTVLSAIDAPDLTSIFAPINAANLAPVLSAVHPSNFTSIFSTIESSHLTAIEAPFRRLTIVATLLPSGSSIRSKIAIDRPNRRMNDDSPRRCDRNRQGPPWRRHHRRPGGRARKLRRGRNSELAIHHRWPRCKHVDVVWRERLTVRCRRHRQGRETHDDSRW